MNEIQELAGLIVEHKWTAAAAIVIGLLVRLSKEGKLAALTTKLNPRHRSWVAIGLGAASVVVDSLGRGTKCSQALLSGFISACIAIAGHELLIESLRGGKELLSPKGEEQ